MTDLLHELKGCDRCSLRCNQQPLVDIRHENNEVFWIGLSAVKVVYPDQTIPLSACTNSGRVLADIEGLTSETFFYRTNIVKCLPLENDKIRYPSTAEMKACFHNLELEISSAKPKIVFLLGKQVIDFVGNKFGFKVTKLDSNFNYEGISVNNIEFIPVHHPSYILVYKRKKLNLYQDKISKIIKLKTNIHKQLS